MNELYLSREQSRRVDQIAVEEYGLTGLVLMENAGRSCADKLCELEISGSVVICCGKGNNAGDGFVLARHLDLRNHQVHVLLFCPPGDLRGDAARNFAILDKADIPYSVWERTTGQDWLRSRLSRVDWVVDALLGTGARGQPRAPLDEVIKMLNAVDARKLAVDVPSGLDCDTGQPSASTFRADHTCTFVARKTGFQAPAAQPFLGQVHTMDIGSPPQVAQAARAEPGRACGA